MNARLRRVATVLAILLVVSMSATPTISVPPEDRTGSFDIHRSDPGVVTGSGSVTNLSAVHRSGVTGEGVRVGVIGRRFAPDGAALSGHVGGSRQFDDGPVLRVAGTKTHDTAVAEIVARTAPDADLYLASVGSRAEPAEYAAAIEWLLAQDVDVIVDAASYFPPSGAAAERMNEIASRATASGVVFVTSAGNYAERHWRGSTNGSGWVSFDRGVQANPLGSGNVEGRVTLRLYWQSGADYDLYLYRYRPNGPDPVVAKSTRRQASVGDHGEAIDTTVPKGRYYVAIYGRANTSRETQLDLFAVTEQLRYTVADGSMVPPATAANVIAVGAATEQGGVRPYSSRGPSLDVTAPDGARTRAAGMFYGTSAAAPLVAGTAALMESRHGDLTPAEAERILESTAVRRDGRLHVDPAAAVAATGPAAATETRTATTRTTTAATRTTTAAGSTNATVAVDGTAQTNRTVVPGNPWPTSATP